MKIFVKSASSKKAYGPYAKTRKPKTSPGMQKARIASRYGSSQEVYECPGKTFSKQDCKKVRSYEKGKATYRGSGEWGYGSDYPDAPEPEGMGLGFTSRSVPVGARVCLRDDKSLCGEIVESRPSNVRVKLDKGSTLWYERGEAIPESRGFLGVDDEDEDFVFPTWAWVTIGISSLVGLVFRLMTPKK